MSNEMLVLGKIFLCILLSTGTIIVSKIIQFIFNAFDESNKDGLIYVYVILWFVLIFAYGVILYGSYIGVK